METRPHHYDAFISYSQQRDTPLAQALEGGLRTLLRRPLRGARTKVFRDRTSLAASSSLPGAIKEALSCSRFFVYLASPEAAVSPWVREEVATWVADHPVDRMMIALAAGEIAWGQGDFDWARSTALPEELRGVFAHQPLWVDFRGHRDADRHDMSPGAPFRDLVVTIAAPLHGLRKDELESQDLHERRRTKRKVQWATGVGAFVLAGALTAGCMAFVEHGKAGARARTNASRALADRAQEVAQSDPRKAAQFALYAYAVEPTAEAARALGQAVTVNGSTVQNLQMGQEEVAAFQGAGHIAASNVAVSRNGAVLAYYSDLSAGSQKVERREIHLYDIRRHKELPSLPGAWPQDGGGLAFSGDGKILAVETPSNRVDVWDVARRRVLRTITASDSSEMATAQLGLRSFTLSDDGRRLAATYYLPDTGEGMPDSRLTVWNTTSGATLHQESVDAAATSLAYDLQGRLHALDSHTGTARVLDADAREWSTRRRLEGFPRRDEQEVTLSADGSRAYLDAPAVGDEDELWDLGKGRRVSGQSSSGLDHPVMAAQTDALIGSGTQGQQIAVYTRGLRRGRSLGSFSFPVRSVASDGKGQWVAAASADGGVALFSNTTLREGVVLANKDRIKDTELTPDKRLAYRVGRDGTTFWAVDESGVRRLGRIPWHLDATPDEAPLIASRDGSRMVVVLSGVASLWNPRSEESPGIPVMARDYTPLTFLPDDRTIVAVKGNSLVVQTPGTWEVLQKVPIGDGSMIEAAVSSDRRTVAILDGDTVTAWRWTRQEGLRQVRKTHIDTGDAWGRTISVSPHGEHVAVVNEDNRLATVHLQSGRVSYSTAVEPTGRMGAAFSADGSLLVQAYGEGKEAGLQFWNASTGDDSGTWSAAVEDSQANSPDLFNGPDGSVLELGSDGNLLRHVIDVGAWRETLCALRPGRLPGIERTRYLSNISFTEPCTSRSTDH
ncbi:hypothetical protein ACFVW1_02580 [Streptomyces olivochromogenes]|uniref:hypothetical protein n=1 Tax=Streptomyces olivochromogenes TaxID=1963 RepID=UPI0036DAB4D5